MRQPTTEELTPPPQWRQGLAGQAAALQAGAARAARATADLSADYLRSTRAPASSAPVLARAIRYSRAEARRAGLREIPPHVREALAPYFPERTLSEVRWTLPDRGLDLGSVLAGWYFAEGAVALEDVVVFSDQALAQNVWFWAHELTHVEQYSRLGVDGFARRYVADWRAIEAEATARADRIAGAIRAELRMAEEAQRRASGPAEGTDRQPSPPHGRST